MVEAALKFFSFEFAHHKGAELAIYGQTNGRVVVAVEKDGKQIAGRRVASYIPNHGWSFVRECYA